MSVHMGWCNHSCAPNLQVEKWYVNRTPRLGLWAKRDIVAGEELSYNYSVKWYGDDQKAQRCHCGDANCTGYLGRAPNKAPAAAKGASTPTMKAKPSAPAKGASTPLKPAPTKGPEKQPKY